MPDRATGQEERQEAPAAVQAPTRSLRGLPALRGSGSLRGGLGRGSTPSNASMVPSRSSYAVASGSATPGPKMQFRPVIPQRRKPSESPAPQATSGSSETVSSPSGSAVTGSGRGSSLGRGRSGPRPPRHSAPMTASGPFALGPSSRPSSSKARVTPLGPGGPSSAEPGNGDSLKADPDRASYRNPDKVKDTEDYSDPEDGEVTIIDMDQVHCLDDLAPIALPRVTEKKSRGDQNKAAAEQRRKKANRVKQEGVRIKSESDADDVTLGGISELETKRATTVSSGTATPQPETDPEGNKVKTADALDLSESEGEEILDDLVDDFVFNKDEDVHQVLPEKRLYLFQFPQLFPKFKAGPAAEQAESADPTSDAASPKRRTVSFAEGTTGGAGASRPIEIKDEISDESGNLAADVSDEDGSERDDRKASVKRSAHGTEGQIGKLDVYRDGRVFLRLGELIMEVTGGSQSTFLQQVMLLDKEKATATTLGELHRKFIVTPELDCMLNDISLHDEEQRILAQQVKTEADELASAGKRSKFGGTPGAPGTDLSTLGHR